MLRKPSGHYRFRERQRFPGGEPCLKTFLKPLSKEEESLCIQALRDEDAGRSKEAKQLLIERNLRLVAHIAKKYASSEEGMEDLISIGTIGLIKAVDTFDPEKNNRLAAYAARCIDNAILSQMRLLFQTSTLRAIRNQNGVFRFLYKGQGKMIREYRESLGMKKKPFARFMGIAHLLPFLRMR